MSFFVWINNESWWLFTSLIILLAIGVYFWINKQADNNQLANNCLLYTSDAADE